MSYRSGKFSPVLLTLIAIFCVGTTSAESPVDFDQGREIRQMPSIQPRRDRVAIVNRVLTDRLDNLLPQLMRESNIDMWLVLNREYAEDPVFFSLVPEPIFAARRTTMLVFHDRGEKDGVERLTVSRYPLEDLYEAAWEGGDLEEQWHRLAEVIAERDPKRIAVNTSRDWPLADGLTAGLDTRLRDALGTEYVKRLVPAESLVIRWLETRTALEMELYPQVVAIARRVIAEAFSDQVITPGATTTADVAWYIRQRFHDLDLEPWFQPYVNVQRRGVIDERDAPFFGNGDTRILRGDVLHTDVGICYLRLCTDTQEMGYVLRVGETDVPEGLKNALGVGNRWQDLLTSSFVIGRTGNEILTTTLERASKESIVASVYTHPLGFFGHAAGPTIGMWDNQGPTPIRGDWKMHAMTGYAIEGNIKAPVPEWDDQWVQIKLEQSAVYDGETVQYLAGRQTRWHVVP
ncbi:MAG: aminopeptidase P family protein [Acidobacteriota bacterium]|nr:aminopeptidase P family protein [Acidobacteriota bacterium]MDH3785674.1 aminopeptidase P family protein [Acidobacteriota bacterium]